ncbi:transposase [Bifidobacterium minimum]|uniref:transposase n=1 Tax=Bifidobacterium minimum TaxID=1693 RepID=UPI003B84A133
MDHNGDPNRVTLVTCDMSPGFAKGIRGRPPDAAGVIDEFHTPESLALSASAFRVSNE